MNPNSTEVGAGIRAEAARYALTRRLVPALRHDMVVNLQPIGLVYEVLDRKLVTGERDQNAVLEGLAKINHLARAAVSSCLDVVTWLAPDAGAATTVGAGVNDCLAMLRSNFTFRGFTISNHVGEAALQVPRTALREVLTAALIATTDTSTGPVELVLSAQLSTQQAVVSFELRPGQGAGFPAEMAYRVLEWSDVQALAQAHMVQVSRQGPLVAMTLAASTAAA